MEELGGDREHRHVHQAREAERDHHVEPLEAQHATALGVVAAANTTVGQRGVQIDHVRHHRGPDDADGEKQCARAGEAREQTAQRAVNGRPDAQRLIQKAEKDDPQQRRDRQLEAAEAAPLQLENRKRNHPRDQAGRQERHTEQQVQPQRGTEKLGDVRRHRDQLGLHPHAPCDGAGKAGADHLRQVVVGDDPELGREVLD